MSQELNFHKDSSYKTIHFYFTQIPVLLVLEIASGMMYMQLSEKFVMSFYCLPSIIVYYFLLFKCGWGGDWRSISRRFFFSMIGFFIFVPIFFSIYFLVWNPTLSIQWFKSSACRPVGQTVTMLGNLERYGLQQVYINTDVKGLACLSNHKTNGNQMKSYDFYHKGDYYSCDSNYNSTERQSTTLENSDQNGDGRLLHQNQYDQHDYLFDEEEQFSEQSRFLQSTLSSYNVNANTNATHNQDITPKRSGLTKRCRTQYTFSEVKIPSWLCQSAEDNYNMIKKVSEEIFYEQPCSYAYYGSKENARINGRTMQTELKDQKDFVIVRLDSEVYYYEEGFICLILFAMIPAFLFSFQAPFSYLVYKGMLIFYRESIKEENDEITSKGVIQEIPNSKYADDNPGSTSQTERQKQKLEPHQIVQLLSPNSLQKDRDFYDIYNQTRRKQVPQQFLNPTVVVNTEEPMNITKFNGDTTKSVMIKKDKPNQNQAQSIDDLEDQQGQTLNGPRNVTHKSNEDSSSEEENDGQDCSYIKIRNIYKKKLNPHYQKETRKQKKEGKQVDNEEIKVIQEMKQQQIQYSEKQQEKKKKRNINANNSSNGNESPTLDGIQHQSDYQNIFDISNNISDTVQQNQQASKDERSSSGQNSDIILEFNQGENSSNQQSEKEKEEKIFQINEESNISESQIEKLEQVYELYADQINKLEKTVSSPPQETHLIQ